MHRPMGCAEGRQYGCARPISNLLILGQSSIGRCCSAGPTAASEWPVCHVHPCPATAARECQKFFFNCDCCSSYVFHRIYLPSTRWRNATQVLAELLHTVVGRAMLLQTPPPSQARFMDVHCCFGTRILGEADQPVGCHGNETMLLYTCQLLHPFLGASWIRAPQLFALNRLTCN